MLYYDRIEFSEGIDVDKTSASKKCDVLAFLKLVLSFNKCLQ